MTFLQLGIGGHYDPPADPEQSHGGGLGGISASDFLSFHPLNFFVVLGMPIKLFVIFAMFPNISCHSAMDIDLALSESLFAVILPAKNI